MTCGPQAFDDVGHHRLPPSLRSGLGGPAPMRLPSPPARTTPTSAPLADGAVILKRVDRHGCTMRSA